MRLTDYTDYSLRVLMYCASHRDRLVTIAELAEQHRVSKNHLMKVVNDLARSGHLETIRGRSGGVRLLGDPAAIRVGDVVRQGESDFKLVECFDAESDTCTLTPRCRLKRVFAAALKAFFEELDRATLADITLPKPRAVASAPIGATPNATRKPVTVVRAPVRWKAGA
ncbi:MAG: Rrf2 family transcriptional regulator [Rubrivivax sp.]